MCFKGLFSLFFSNSKGFSLVGLLAAAGLMGGLSLVVTQLTKQQVANEKKAETGVEIVALSERILRTLYDGDACKKTIQGGTLNIPSPAPPTPIPALPVITAGTNITIGSIKSRNNRDVIVTGNTYGNRLVKISSMTLRVDSQPIVGGQVEAELRVVMSRESRAYTGPRTLLKTFPLMLNLDGSSEIVGCVSNASAVTNTVAEKLCQDLEGPSAWDPTTRSCNITPCGAGLYMVGFETIGGKRCGLPIGNSTCPAGQAVYQIVGGVPSCRGP